MAYKVNPPNTNPPDATAGGPVTMTDVENFFAGNESPEFYELETAEVVEIYLDENDLPLNKDGDPDWSKYGWAKVRMSVSSKRDTDIVEARPLNSNIKEYPLPGEFVIVADKYLGDRYYTQKINASDSVNFNYLPGFSTPDATMQTITNQTIKNFRPDSRIRQLQAEEGDITFNGRFGQSIRFGSNIKYGGVYGPNILMRTGQGEVPTVANKPVKEDINLDGSSIWMTSDQLVQLNFKREEIPNPYYHWLESAPGIPEAWGGSGIEGAREFGGNQIILNSDRLIFNSNKNSILMSSPTMIGLSATKEIGLEVPVDTGRVMLGDAGLKRTSTILPEDIMGIEPVLGGDQTMKLFSQLIDAINGFAGVLSTAVAGPGLPWGRAGVSPINAAASQLRATLTALKKRLTEPLSTVVMVGHIKGPSDMVQRMAGLRQALEQDFYQMISDMSEMDQELAIEGRGYAQTGLHDAHIDHRGNLRPPEYLEEMGIPPGGYHFDDWGFDGLTGASLDAVNMGIDYEMRDHYKKNWSNAKQHLWRGGE